VEAYYLDRACVNPNLNWPAPKPRDYYKNDLWRRLSNFINGRKTESWVVTEKAPQRKLVGLATINSEWGRPHNLQLRITPEWRGKLERPLLAKLIRRLRYLRGTNILMDHLAGDETTNSLLSEANFQTRRYLTFMQLFIN
ncbi:MAG: hypothetical protein WAM60_24385, partial [Candidatus Promineifilaceae bacterium]